VSSNKRENCNLPFAASLLPFYALFYTLYILCLGALALWLWQWLTRGHSKHGRKALSDSLGEMACLGLLLNYVLYLLLHESRELVWLIAVPASLGLMRLVKPCRALDSGRRHWKLGVLLLLFTPFVVATLYEPLHLLDARYIWYHHARAFWMFDYAELAPYLRDVYFTHSNYPKLLPVMGAQIAGVFGFWNDVLPKIASASLLMLFLLSACSFGRNFWITAAASFIMAPVFVLTGGYADGPLAVYALLVVAALASFMELANHPASYHPSRLNLHQTSCLRLALLASGVALNLKNEGVLFVACLLAAYVLFYWGRRGCHFPRLCTVVMLSRFVFKNRCWWPWWLAGLAPFVLWQVLSRHWGLENDLAINAGLMHNLAHRLPDLEAWKTYGVFLFIYAGNKIGWILLAASICVAAEYRYCGRLYAHSLLAYTVAALYFLAMTLVYFGTPYEMSWHLRTSVLRTMYLPMTLCIYSIVASASHLLASAPARSQKGVYKWPLTP